MSDQYITIKGAKEHNLKNIDLQLPRNQLIIITGLSGSGKSSLAFDTIYAEGQRRYVESLSAYARQFLEQLQKPNVESIEGLSPAIAIEQRSASSNPRSTVGTTTEIYDYLRLLFAKVGIPYCSVCGDPIRRQSAQEIVERILLKEEGTWVALYAPCVRGKKGAHAGIFEEIKRAGFTKVRVDGQIYKLQDTIKLDKRQKHQIDILVDRLQLKKDIRTRLTDSIETALKTAEGLVEVEFQEGSGGVCQAQLFSEQYACPRCGVNIPEIEPRLFSFNSPYGACPSCGGLGTKNEIDEELVIPDRTKSINQGAIAPWRRGGRGYLLYYRGLLREYAYQNSISLDVPWGKLSREVQRMILYGSAQEIWGKPFEGVIPHLERLFKETDSDYLKQEINKYMSSLPCPSCKGARLKSEALCVRIGGKTIVEITSFSIAEAKDFFARLAFSQKERHIAQQILREISQRFDFMVNVGLDYLTLDRISATLSGGEAQRIRLATQIGAGLVGVLYVLDEPSIGLHQRDNVKLIDTLKRLRNLGNTLIVVEHDEATIRNADYIVDLGPGAGKQGGGIVVNGPLDEVIRCEASLTGKYLRGELSIPVPKFRRTYQEVPCLEIHDACEHNLKHITVKIPLGRFVGVSGVSGSGKSTLIDEILYRGLASKLYGAKLKPGRHKKITGTEYVDKVIVVDQTPIGRTPRSNPATYIGVFSLIRDLFSKLPEAKIRGYQPGRFSFNVKGGRCEACQGDGIKKIEMHFLPDVYVPCEVCKGKRFNSQTLEVKYKGKSISDILEMSIEEAMELFKHIPGIYDKLHTVYNVGLGYIELGQSATTLSGGEAQRVKLSAELAKRATGKTLYILDEPTTGLHFADIEKLINVLQALVDAGNTVLVIEHNLDVLKSVDYIIDLGPEGGERGGEIVAVGTPEEIVRCGSFTGQYLQEVLKKT